MNTVTPAFLRPAPPSTDTYRNDLQEHLELFLMLSALKPVVQRAARCWSDCLAQGGKLMFCGNGGSAADCQHLAAELTGRLLQERRPLAAMALTTDSSALTCIANDYHFDQVFARQVLALGRTGDCLVAISTSGASTNVLQAVHAARERGLHTLALTGRDGGALAPLCEQAIVVPSFVTARIQEAHIFIGHSLCALTEQQLAARGLL